jgi:hypothetical protein
VKGQEDLIVDGRTGEDPYVDGGGGMLPGSPLAIGDFPTLFPATKSR